MTCKSYCICNSSIDVICTNILKDLSTFHSLLRCYFKAADFQSCRSYGYDRVCKGDSAVTITISDADDARVHCYNKTEACDGYPHCGNGFDEKFCQRCKDFEFRCDHDTKEPRCFTRFQLCDFKYDCVDQSDELIGTGSTTHCQDVNRGVGTCETSNENIVVCLSAATCHSKADVCIKDTDCADLTQFCPPFLPYQYLCWDGKTLLGRAELCDNKEDCKDMFQAGGGAPSDFNRNDQVGSSEERRPNFCKASTACTNLDDVNCLEDPNTDVCVPKSAVCLSSFSYTVGSDSCNEAGVVNTDGNLVNAYCAYECPSQGRTDCRVDEGNGKCVYDGSSVHCVCFDGYTYPIGAGGTDYSKCEPKCNVSDCGTGAIGCKGADNAFMCICDVGYTATGVGVPCAAVQCTKHSDCNKGDLTLFKCDLDTYDCICTGGIYDTSLKFCKLQNGDCDIHCRADIATADHNECMVTTNSDPGDQDFMCECYAGSSHPVNNDGTNVADACGDTCHDDQCGATDSDSTGHCIGTIKHHICACKTAFVHPMIMGTNGNMYVDRSRCEEPCNAMLECGAGASGCAGTKTAYQCFCKSNYYQSTPKDRCVEKCVTTGNYSTDFTAKCGSHATNCTEDALVTDDNFCICGEGSVKRNGVCVDDCFKDIVEACGEGASYCQGSPDTNKITCHCREGYRLHVDGKCHEMNCMERGSNLCIHGQCYGGYWSYKCKCDPGYSYNVKKRCCEDPSCDVAKCGKGYIHGVMKNYATSCSPDTNDKRDCECLKGFNKKELSSGDEVCVIAGCANINCSVNQDDSHAGTCFGDSIHFQCKCMEGYKLVEIQRYKVVPKMKVCAPMDCMDSMKTLCNGNADYCTGSVKYHQCHCKKGFINPMVNDQNLIHQVPDMTRCIPARCDMSECGAGAESCHFIYTSPAETALLQCNCTKFGYKRNEKGDKCLPIPCDEANDDDKVTACGGAKNSNCTSGTLVDPHCDCDEANHYYPSPDFRKCLSTCKHNEVVKRDCGMGNGCHGPYDDFECVCEMPGWTVDPNDPKKCLEIKCDGTHSNLAPEEVAKKACGPGAEYCTGTWNYPGNCTCAYGYVPSSTTGKCVKDSCESNTDAIYKCRLDANNKCSGSYMKYKCQCTHKAFAPNADHTECEEISCESGQTNGVDNYKHACGMEGSIDCLGTLYQPKCNCSEAMHYYPSIDGTRCMKDPCSEYEDIRMKCGKGNKCRGTKDDYICLCQAKYYTLSGDKKSCDKVNCTDSNKQDVCGKGATACSGHAANPVCECDDPSYIPSPDGKKCMNANDIDCMYDEDIRLKCGLPNRCIGTKSSYICVCHAHGYKYHDDNSTICDPIPCGELPLASLCGTGATGCKGYVNQHICQCDSAKDYEPSPDGMRCMKKPCHKNPEYRKKCMGNPCIGTYNDAQCICGKDYNVTSAGECEPISCDGADDSLVKELCGYGSKGCKGYIKSRHCLCDHAKGYIVSSDGRYCKPADCKYNQAAVDACGMGNMCKGTYTNWVCVCRAPGYEADGSDMKVCNLKMCTKETAEKYCGEGATDCMGNIKNRTCSCDGTREYVASKDGKRCERAMCNHNPESKKCGPGNHCVGSYTSWQCSCVAHGWEAAEDDRTMCRETKCTKENAVAVCGEGALECSGTMLHPHCKCDVDNYFMESHYETKCVHTDCRYSKEAMEKCGMGNSCEGSYKVFKCICNAKGYKYDMDDPRVCHEMMCKDEMDDHLKICGKGALSCDGSARHPVCKCDASKGYVPNADGTYCELASCYGSNDFIKNCGKGNKCQGTKDNYVCLCGYGWERSEDMKKCEPAGCETLDATRICGDGATYCSGPISDPKCVCGLDDYQPSADLHKCELMDCRFNDTVVKACGQENSCEGSISSWQCKCHGPRWTEDPNDKQTCKYAKCNRKQCGMDPKKGPLGYLAENCTGTFDDPRCNCIENYSGGADKKYCLPEVCDHTACGGNGKCVGFKVDYYCHCDEGYIPSHDKKTCEPAPCRVEDCGFGMMNGRIQNYAKSCSGTTESFNCTCLDDEGIMEDGDRCKQKPCSYHPNGHCDVDDTSRCVGEFYNFYCNCTGDTEIARGDPRKCVQARCELADCGSKMVGTLMYYFATACVGTKAKYDCICKTGHGIDTSDSNKCKELPCDAVPNVCSGKGTCNIGEDGTYFNHTCNCTDNNYEPDDTKMKCVPKPCNDNQCGGVSNGKCMGTAVQYYCNCKPGFEVGYQDGKPTCEEAKCRNEQCGGTALKPYGRCGQNQLYNSFSCSCNPGYAHPMVITGMNSEAINTTCDHECKASQCAGNGVDDCKGTISNFICNCENGYENPVDEHGNKIYTACEKSCETRQCNPEGGVDATATCDGTEDQYMCKCKDGFAHPMDDDCKPIKTSCKKECEDKQCGEYDNMMAGECNGTETQYTCECKDGFTLAKDRHGRDVHNLCVDENECMMDPYICGNHTAYCKNLIGLYKCECPDGHVYYEKEKKCIPNGGWGPYTFSQCSKPCGMGVMNGTRECLLGEGKCVGSSMKDETCNHFNCQDIESCSENEKYKENCNCQHPMYFPYGLQQYVEKVFEFNVQDHIRILPDVRKYLIYFTELAKTDICNPMKYNDEKRSAIMEAIKHNQTAAENIMQKLDDFKQNLRTHISCLEDFTDEPRETLYAQYNRVIKYKMQVEFLVKDFTMEKKTLELKQKRCMNADDGFEEWIDIVAKYGHQNKFDTQAFSHGMGEMW